MASKFTRKDFLEALFGQYYRENRGFILVKSVKQGDPKMSTRYFPNVEILAREQYGEDRDVYFGTCPRERMKPEPEHVQWVTALWADMDIGREGHDDGRVFLEGPEQAAKTIRSFPLPPSIAVDSGRGLHLYWLLGTVIPVLDSERIERILKNVHDRLHCGEKNRLDTVMRLPDTLNHKVPDAIARCRVTFINSNLRYDLSDFESLEERVHIGPQDRFAPAVSSAGPVAVNTPSPELEQFVNEETAHSALQAEDSITADELLNTRVKREVSPIRDDVRDHLVPLSETLEYADDALRTELPPMSDYGERRLDAGRLHAPAEPRKRIELEKLAASRTEVEIALLGSETIIRGILSWHDGGIIGVQTGELAYTIPLTSVSFIRHRHSYSFAHRELDQKTRDFFV